MNLSPRLYIITGKGGVGKSTISLALTQKLIQSGKKAKYLEFKQTSFNSSYSENKEFINLAKSLNISTLTLDLEMSAKEYVSRKIKSKTLGKWVVSTSFFKALINMIPGFSYLIYLGKAIYDLEQDPNLIYVLDSPSTGHALTMFESLNSFSNIFKSGLLQDDTKKVLSAITQKGFVKLQIWALPQEMPMNESSDFCHDLKEIAPFLVPQIHCNNCFSKISDLEVSLLPEILQQKIQIEQNVLDSNKQKLSSTLPHFFTKNKELISNISNSLSIE